MKKEIEELIKKIEKTGKTLLVEKTSEDAVKKFEDKNKIQLPKQYKEWLLISDGGELYLPGGVQLYGVEHKPIIDINDNDIPSDEYVVIGALATGDPIVFKKGSEQIAIYNHELGVIDREETYENFTSFLEDLIKSFGSEGNN